MVMVSLAPTVSVRFAPIAIVSFAPDRLGAVRRRSLIVSLLPTVSVRSTPMVIVSLLSTVSVRSCLTMRRLVVVDRLLAVVAHPVRLVVLDLDVLVLLGVDEELLRALLVLEADLVEVAVAAALAASAS